MHNKYVQQAGLCQSKSCQLVPGSWWFSCPTASHYQSVSSKLSVASRAVVWYRSAQIVHTDFPTHIHAGLDGEGLRIAIGPNIAPGRNPANYNYTYIPYTEASHSTHAVPQFSSMLTGPC
jgi:hypothetical protein